MPMAKIIMSQHLNLEFLLYSHHLLILALTRTFFMQSF